MLKNVLQGRAIFGLYSVYNNYNANVRFSSSLTKLVVVSIVIFLEGII